MILITDTPIIFVGFQNFGFLYEYAQYANIVKVKETNAQKLMKHRIRYIDYAIDYLKPKVHFEPWGFAT
jgi:nitrogenase molybdenum-iron protein alpha/beta subunit